MFILSKLLGFLLNPLIWIGTLLVLGLFIQRNRIYLLRAALILFLVFSNPLLSNWIMSLQEADPVALDSSNTNRVGILLTGMTCALIDKPGIHFESGADRFTETLALYKTNVIERIIITGGSGLIGNQEFTEAPLLADLAGKYGVPDSVLILETRSRNTYENALFTKPLLDSLEVEKCLIITSSFHMNRALKCFEKQGVESYGFPTDFRAAKLDFSIYSFVPSTSAIFCWETLLHEWFGMVYYRLKGFT